MAEFVNENDTPNMKIPKRMYKKLLNMVSSRVLQDALRDNSSII